MQIDFKWFAIIALFVIVGAFAFGATSVSSAMDPTKGAQARFQDAQTADYVRQVDAQRQLDAIDVETHRQQQALLIQAKQQELEAQAKFQQEQNAKILAQMDQQAKFEHERRAKELASLDAQAETQRQLDTEKLAQAQQWTRFQAVLLDQGGWIWVAAALTIFITALAGLVLGWKHYTARKRAAPEEIPVIPNRVSQPLPRNNRHERQLESALRRVNAENEQLKEQLDNLQKQVSDMQPRGNSPNGNGKTLVLSEFAPHRKRLN